jgi:hypothetical protein
MRDKRTEDRLTVYGRLLVVIQSGIHGYPSCLTLLLFQTVDTRSE